MPNRRRRGPDGHANGRGVRGVRNALGRVFGLDLVLLHAPSVWDFREEVIVQGPLADVIPSTTEFEMYPIGMTSIAAYLDANNYNTRLVNSAGLVPLPNGSGRRSGNLRKTVPLQPPRRAAEASMIRPGLTRDYYLKKRGQQRTHNQARVALPAASTSSGRYCASTEPGRQHHPHAFRPLDNNIEVPDRPGRYSSSKGSSSAARIASQPHGSVVA